MTELARPAATAGEMLAVGLALVGLAVAQPPWLPWKIEQKDIVGGLTVFPSPKGCKPVANGKWVPGSNCTWVADKTAASWRACQALCEKNAACNSFDFATSWSAPGSGECYFRSDHCFGPKGSYHTFHDRNHTSGTRVKPGGSCPLPPAPGGLCSAGTGAGLKIHGSGTFTTSFVPDATLCCRACIVPHCSTWSFGWGNGTECHLSTGAPVSTTKDPKFASGVKGHPVPPGPSPAPLPAWTKRCEHPASPIYAFGCLFGQSQVSSLRNNDDFFIDKRWHFYSKLMIVSMENHSGATVRLSSTAKCAILRGSLGDRSGRTWVSLKICTMPSA